MSNEEFDNLKEELMWEGSSVVMLSMEEFMYYTLSEWWYGIRIFVWSGLKIGVVIAVSHYAGPDEQRFLEASMAYVSGNPIMTDKEYDKLKMKLKVLGHLVVTLITILFVKEYFVFLYWHLFNFVEGW